MDSPSGDHCIGSSGRGKRSDLSGCQAWARVNGGTICVGKGEFGGKVSTGCLQPHGDFLL